MDDTHARKSLGVLLAVIVVVVGVGTLVQGGVRSLQARTRDAQRQRDIAALQRAFEVHATTYGNYPVARFGVCIDGTDPIATTLAQKQFMERAVGDPVAATVAPANTREPHCYHYASVDGSTYTLRYFLEQEGATIAVEP